MKVLGIDIESTKMARKLRAIAKHAEALADDLDAIDNAWQCDCGSVDYSDEALHMDDNSITLRTCIGCGDECAVDYDFDLPTRFEGSE